MTHHHLTFKQVNPEEDWDINATFPVFTDWSHIDEYRDTDTEYDPDMTDYRDCVQATEVMLPENTIEDAEKAVKTLVQTIADGIPDDELNKHRTEHPDTQPTDTNTTTTDTDADKQETLNAYTDTDNNTNTDTEHYESITA